MSNNQPFISMVDKASQTDPTILNRVGAKTLPPSNVKPQPEPVGIIVSSIEEQDVLWLWPNRIPRGALSLIDGDPGSGKSLLSLDISARVSRGYPLPGEREFTEPAGVVILSAEDSPKHVIRPRLRTANADLDNVLIVPYSPDYQRQPTISKLPADVPVLRRAIQRVNAALAVFDVLAAYVPAALNMHRDQDCRLALAPLAELADETGCAILLIRHLNKNAGVNAMYRGGGSVGIIGAARSGLLLANDPSNTDQRVLATVKSNLGSPTNSISFRIRTLGKIPVIDWLGASQHTADSLLTPVSAEDRTARQDAAEFLREELRAGPVDCTKLIKAAQQMGVCGERTLKAAKKDLGCKSAKVGDKWLWMLPKDANGQGDSL